MYVSLSPYLRPMPRNSVPQIQASDMIIAAVGVGVVMVERNRCQQVNLTVKDRIQGP